MDPPERSIRNDGRRGGSGGGGGLLSSSSSSFHSNRSSRRRPRQRPPDQSNIVANVCSESPRMPSSLLGGRPPRRRSASANDLAFFAEDTDSHSDDGDDDNRFCVGVKTAKPALMISSAAARNRNSGNSSVAVGSIRSSPSYDSLVRRRGGRSQQQPQQHLVMKSRQQHDFSSRSHYGYDYDDDDDDTESLFSAASSSCSNIQHKNSNNHRNRRKSQSSSVTSRTSQSSHNSSFRLPKKNYRNGLLAGMDNSESDDSFRSLLSFGDEDEDRQSNDEDDMSASASSSSSSSHMKSSTTWGMDSEDVAPAMKKQSERMVAGFAETLTRLELLGLGINDTDRMDEDDHDVIVGAGGDGVIINGCRSNDETFYANKSALESFATTDKECAWWIQELEAEGWLRHDTSTIYANDSSSCNVVPLTELQSATALGKADADRLREIFGDGEDMECGVAVVNKDQAKSAVDDCDTSSIDTENEDVGDWEERLWSLARAHFLEYKEMESINPPEVDEQALKDQEEYFFRHYDMEQNGVCIFRSLLLKCVESYVYAFHGKVIENYRSVEEGNGEDEVDTAVKSITKHQKCTPALEQMYLNVHPYIPLSIARCLFMEVIKFAETDTQSLVIEIQQQVHVNLEAKAAFIASILVDDVLNIFRRYKVITAFKSPMGSGRERLIKDRKRVSRNRVNKSFIDADAELDDFLYGEMLQDEIIGDEEEKSETEELEIRIRSSVVRMVLNNFDKGIEGETGIDPYWSKSAICQVLLSNVRAVTDSVAAGNSDYYDDPEHCQVLACRTCQPMVHLYCMRYSPIFLLRVLHYESVGSAVASHSNGNTLPRDTILGDAKEISVKVLVDLLYDESYVRGRVEYQGPFDATMTHLSNWQGVSSFQNINEKIWSRDVDETHKTANVLGDENSYDRLVTVLSSILHSHLKTMLDKTGFRQSDVNRTAPDISSMHNFSEIASNCIETGRALHHIGVCLGRRQRDCVNSQYSRSVVSSGNPSNTVSLEVTCYRNALDAYRAATTVLSKAESVEVFKTTGRVGEGHPGNRIMTGKKFQQDSEVRTLPNTTLQDIRVAKSSVELHLADTLFCLGFCHDKLLEYDKSLLAYRESLSLYVTHVGSSHTMVSKVLHNMGAIHAEQGQWKEATRCFRQCLAVLKRRADNQCLRGAQQISVTLQCLGNSLAELGEFDASLACFDEIIHASETTDLIAMDVQSQMGWVHLNQAFNLSREFNRLCHALLCAGNHCQSNSMYSGTYHSKTCHDADLHLVLDRQLRLEQLGKDSFAKSIHSRRQFCYTSPGNAAKQDENEYLNKNDSDVCLEASSAHVAALAKDLLAMGRLEFRSRSYQVALSYFWESLLLCGLLIAQRLGDNKAAGTISNLLVFDGTSLKSQNQLFRVSAEHFAVIDLIGISSIMDSASVEFVQLLFLIGVSYTRTHHFEFAHKILHKALAILKSPTVETDKANVSLESIVVELDIAHLHLRIGFVDFELGNIEVAASHYKESIRVFRVISIHPFVTSKSNETDADLQNTGVGKRFPIGHIINNGIACAFYRLGVACAERGRHDDAMNCFEDAASIFKDIQAATDKFANWKSVNLFPLASRCFWEEASAVDTALFLSDINERSGRICIENDPQLFSLQCFERCIGMRELVNMKAGCISNVDSESSIERFDESAWDIKDICNYSAMLLLHEQIEEDRDSGYTLEEDASVENEGSMPSRADILFRLGNLQLKLGKFTDAIDSYKKAEELTVEVLGTKEHAIIMNILHKMGNAYRSVAVSSLSHRKNAKKKANACYSESMRICQVLYGKHNVKSAELLQSLAILHVDVDTLWLAISIDENNDTNDDENAYKFFKEALSIQRKEIGSHNEIEVAFILNQLGDLCLRNALIGVDDSIEDAETFKLLTNAIAYLSESLNIRMFLLDQCRTSVADTYQSIGVAHFNLALTFRNGDKNKMDSETRKAFRSLNKALEIRTSDLSGKDSDSVVFEAHCLFHLGRVEEVNSKYDTAKAYYIKALRLFQTQGKQMSFRVSGPGIESKLFVELEAINLWVARILKHLAVLHKDKGNVGDCISCYEESLRIRRRCRGAGNSSVEDARTNFALAQALQDHSRYDKSIEYFSRALRTYVAHFGKECIYVADILSGLGKTFAMKLVFTKTLQCYKKAIRVYEHSEDEALKGKKGLLHREIAVTLLQLDWDILEVLDHYRSCVVFLEEFSECKVEQEATRINQQLLRCYSELLVILRQVLDIESDTNIKGELYEEIDDVLHRMGNLHALFAQYDDALNCFLEVLATQRKAHEQSRVADILFNMGNIYLEQGRYEESLGCLHESYEITKEVLGEDNKELHSTMFLMSIAMTKLSNYESALTWLTHSIDVLSSQESYDRNEEDQTSRGKTLSQMGAIYEHIGDHTMAFSCLQEAEQLLGATHRDDIELSNALNSMGNLLRSASNHEQALNCYCKSLAIRTEVGDELKIANTKNNIGLVLSAMKNFDRAMAFSAQALRIETDRLGCESVETARALVNTGKLFLDQKLYSRAEKYFGQGLKIFRNCKCDDDPDMGKCVHALGVVKEALFDDESALDYYRQCIRIFKNITGFEKNVTLASSFHNAALIYMRRRDFHSALDCMTDAFNTKLSAFGSSHPETAASQHFLGIISLETEDAQSSHFHLTNALNVRRECFGADNLDVARTLFGLGYSHFTRDEFEEAIKCLSEALSISKLEKSEAESKAELQLGISYQELGNFEIAMGHLFAALHLMNSSPDANRADVAQATFRLGICFCETGQFPQSLEKFNECLEMRKLLLGNLHIDCANTYESIGIVQQKTECHEEAIISFERALAIKKSSCGDNDEDICVLLHFIGSSLFALNKFEEAVGYFQDCSERKKKYHGRADGEYAMSVFGLAAAYAKLGDDRSVECYREAIESGGLSSDSWELGLAHKFLACDFFDKGMHTLSIERYREAVAIFEWNINNTPGYEMEHETLAQCYTHLLELEDKVGRPLSENRAELCHKLASCYLPANKLEDAVLMYREAMMIQTQLHGAEHLSVANSLHNIGNCYRNLSDFEKSAECLVESLSILQKNFEGEHEEVADTCHCLALTRMAKCELEEAASLFETALAIWKKELGNLSLKIASTLYNLAIIGQMRGTWSSALSLCKDALRMQRMTVGDDNTMLIGTLECIGRIYMDKREYEHAIKCFCQCITQKKELQLECGLIYRIRGETLKSQDAFSNAEQFAVKQLGLSQSGEAEQWNLSSEFQELKRETSDRHLLRLAERVMFYGLVLLNLEKFEEALECLQFANVVFQAKYDSDHLTIAANFYHIGFALEKTSTSPKSQHRLEEALEMLTESFRIRKLHLNESHPDLESTMLCLGRVHHKLGNIGDALNYISDAMKSRNFRIGGTILIADDADSLFRIGQLQQQSGKFRQALKSFYQCLDIRKIAGSQHPSVGETLFHIGNLHREIGELDSAQKRFEESLAIARQIDPESIEVADTFFSLGVLHTEQKQFSLALDSYLASLQIQKAKGSKTALAEILNNIGIAYFAMKELDKALIYHEEAFETLRQELGDNHPDVAFCLFSLGTIHREKGDQEDALVCFQQAVRIERSESYLQSLGFCLVKMDEYENAYVCLDEALRMKLLDGNYDTDDDLAEIKRHLGIIFMREKKFDESLRFFEEALSIKLANCDESENDSINIIHCFDGALDSTLALFGTQHLKCAHLLHKKGMFYGAKKDHALAIEAYVEALRIYKVEYGDQHLSVANTLYNLGVSLNGKGCPDKAVRCFTKALRITKARLGEDHLDVSDTFEQIAESYKILLRYRDAKSCYESALSVRKQANCGTDVKSAAIMHELGKLLASEGEWVGAEKAFEESMRVRTLRFGQDNLLVAESMYSLGLLHMARDDSLKALNYLEGSLRIRKSKLANNPLQLADTADSFFSLGAVHCSFGNVCKSLFCYDKAIQIFTDVYGKTSDRVASSIAGKGKCLCSDKQYRKALSCFSECLDIRKSVDGPALSNESGDVLSLMGDAYSQLGDSSNASTSFASALAIYRQTHGSQHQIVADALQKMADHYVNVEEFECGYSCVKEALAIRQILDGDDDTKMGDSLYCQGRILYEWKNDLDAIHCLERAREIFQKSGDGLHINVANSNFYLGCISERKGDFELALKYLQASLSGRRKNLDEFNSEIAVNLATLGRVYLKKSEFVLAVSALSDCLKIREANRGADKISQIQIADALFDLGTALQKSLDTQRSTHLITDALKVYQIYLDDPNDVKIAKCHLCLSEIYTSTNELANAMNSLDQAMSIYESHVRTDPTEKDIIAPSKVHAFSGKAETLFCLATVKERLGDLDTAMKHYRRAMRIYKSLFGSDSLFVGKTLYRIAMMIGQGESIDKAMILLNESLRIRKSNLGNHHEDVAETLFGMGLLLEKRKDYSEAMKAYSDCLRIRSSTFGSDSMEVAEVVVNIGVVRSNKGDFAGARKIWSKALSIYRKKGLGEAEGVVAAVLEHQRQANQHQRSEIQ